MRIAFFLLKIISEASAHNPGQPAHHLNWTMWNIQYHVLLALLLLGLIYYFGHRRLLAADHLDRFKLGRKAFFYYSGLILLFLSLLSPIDTMSDVLGWAHMLQHTIILMVAAPLMALAGPNHISQWALSKKNWQRTGRVRPLLRTFLAATRFNRPFAAWLLYIVTLSLWHIPIFYEAALRWEWLHDIQHILFFVSAYFFWRVLFDPFQANLSPLTGILYCFVASLHGIILGVLMTLSPQAWYGPYILSAPLYGYDPLYDQQLAGFIMWMPAGISYALAALALLLKALKFSSTTRAA